MDERENSLEEICERFPKFGRVYQEFKALKEKASGGEWIEYNKPFWSYKKEKNFTDDGLCNPGVLIETEKGQFLIGHINTYRGECDCCSAINYDDIVLRYKVVWSPEK